MSPLVRESRRVPASLALLCALASSSGCAGGDEATAAETRASGQATAAAVKPLERRARIESAELSALRRHIDFGELAEARALLPIAATAGAEEPLLVARCDALAGEFIPALRSVESARALSPRDPDVYATAAEIYAAAGKPDAAWSEIGRGVELCGDAAELSRARGIVWLLREGGAERGLAFLEAARTQDPTLPFLDHALAQAHLLAGKGALRVKDLDAALRHAKLASELDPGDVDSRRFLADVLAAQLDFAGAIEILTALAASGAPRGGELASLEGELATLEKRAGIAALITHDREAALAHFTAARAHGMSDEELSTGARLLLEEARARVAAGVESYDLGDMAAAEARFRAALVCEPDFMEAQNHLAVVLFQRREFAEAIALWRAVLARAQTEKLELPEPVHLNLAKAEFQNGESDAARATLDEYLRREPEGAWAEETRAMLDRIPPK